ncbi:MAG: MFS transporter, partial [Candidatus Margulisbacteria bacterium]|nr:MFS transporter [Candidatus Margulisiibacteriota bacterium]
MNWIKKFLYTNCSFGGLLLTQTLITWLMFYYAPPTHNPQGLVPLVPIFAMGLAVFVGRLVDAIADPLIGYWSDHAETPWGRRKPFILLGNIPLIFCFIMLWYPPVTVMSQANVWHVMIYLSAFFFFFTVVICPCLALLPELAKTIKERLSLSTWMAFMIIAGAALGMI